MSPVPPEAIDALEAARRCLGTSLVAAYLHGSAVCGGLHPDSDVDIMLVVDRALEAATRRSLLQAFLRISGAPGRDSSRRPLEVTIFTTQVLASASYPPESQFVYGEWLRTAFEAGTVPEPHLDVDHTILLAQALRSSRPLTGPRRTCSSRRSPTRSCAPQSEPP